MFTDINCVGEAVLQTEEYGHIYSSEKELYRRRMYKDNLAHGRIAPNKHGKRSHPYQRRCSVDILNKSMIVRDTGSLKHRLSAPFNVKSIADHVQEKEVKDEVGQVTGWAVNFDKLLRDISGLHVFTEFLKKEFSEENIIFWTTVEEYKQITSDEMRIVKAKDIFDKHLCLDALEPVNIDSVARQQAHSQLDIPTPQIFDVAQHQIYQLMKRDSYARFLKSELYKTYLHKEMEGKPLDIPQEGTRNGKQKDQKEKESKMMIKGEENIKEKRRRSLLPWRNKASKSSMKSPSDAQAKKSKGKEKVQESEIQSKDTPISESKEVIIKNKVLFWIDLPNKKSVDVKAKSNRLIRVVLKPILHKYGFKMDRTEIYMSGHTALLDLEGLVSSLDNQRVVVVPKDDCPGWGVSRTQVDFFRMDTKGKDYLSLGLWKKESTTITAKNHVLTKMLSKATFKLLKNEEDTQMMKVTFVIV
ncbi:hypothetical protein CHS0354_006017 [Potamilus streckersoni]|uniref:Uncharacterized protein n=1 Tax=Potamilus streckersoni TaxID=2493646 RepID=A0AAE0S3B0_9BIVA|nr:hypothetical protein CHS0354_006017 [Potamilus streckersoni]